MAKYAGDMPKVTSYLLLPEYGVVLPMVLLLAQMVHIIYQTEGSDNWFSRICVIQVDHEIKRMY